MKIDKTEYIGKKYGRRTILEFAGQDNRRLWLVKCKCDCGNEGVVHLYLLKKGKSQSCGCASVELLIGRVKKHGLKNHPLYGTWKNIINRCENIKYHLYHRYGGRGIKVCDEWRNNFKAFHDWALANGWRKGLSIDRYPNNDGNYHPSNCRWVKLTEQQGNKSNNVQIEYNGEIKCLRQWAKILNIGVGRIKKGIQNGLSLAEIAVRPPFKHYKKTK